MPVTTRTTVQNADPPAEATLGADEPQEEDPPEEEDTTAGGEQGNESETEAEASGSGGSGSGPEGSKTWATLVEEAGFQPGSIALALSEEHTATPWSEVLAPFRELKGFDLRTSAARFKAYIRKQSDALIPKFFLTLVGGQVKAVFNLKVCYPLAASGDRYVALSGERSSSRGIMVYPALVQLDTSAPDQFKHFKPLKVAALTEAAIKTALEADPEATIVDAAPQGTPSLHAWPFLETHPAIACFFLKGMRARDAFAWVQVLKASIPSSSNGDLEPLLHFVRAALTASGAAGPVRHSAIQSPWTSTVVSESPDLQQWYYDLLAVAVPKSSPASSTAEASRNRSVTFAGDAGDRSEGGPRGEDNGDPDSSALTKALNRLCDIRGNDREPQSSSSFSKYAAFELTLLFRAAGFAAPFGGYVQDQLPEFWRGLAPYRKKSPSTRNYIDTFVTTHWSSERQYSFLPTSQLVTDLTSVTLHGGDKLILWENRHKGLTPLSIQPLEEGNDGSTKLQEYLNYEGTWDNHTPQEREQMTRLSQGQVRFAYTREGLYRNADFAHEAMVQWLGSQCPLRQPDAELRDLYLKTDKFIGYTPENFAALQWMHHSAWRRFFLGEGTGLIEYLVSQVKIGMKLPSENMPEQLRATFRAPRGGNPGGGNPGGGNPGGGQPNLRRPGPPDAGPLQPKKKSRKYAGASFASAFAAEIKRGNENTKTDFNVTGKAICPNEQAMKELLGPEFMALVPDNATVCLRYYLFGACVYGDRCSHTHKLRSEPSGAVLEGIKVRLTARIDALIASHPKE
jgi:hypothetical protein